MLPEIEDLKTINIAVRRLSQIACELQHYSWAGWCAKCFNDLKLEVFDVEYFAEGSYLVNVLNFSDEEALEIITNFYIKELKLINFYKGMDEFFND